MCRWSRGEGKFSGAVLFWLCWVWKNQYLSGMNKYRLEDSNIAIFHKPVGEKQTTTYVLKDQRLRSSKPNQRLKRRFLSGRRLNWAHRKTNHMKSAYFSLFFLSPSVYLFCFEAVQVLYVIQGTSMGRKLWALFLLWPCSSEPLELQRVWPEVRGSRNCLGITVPTATA